MTRATLDTSVGAAVAGASLYACHLFSLSFPSTQLYVNDFGESIVWGSNTYQPQTRVLDWSGYEENNDTHPRAVTINLTATPDLVAAVTGDNFSNALVNIYIAVLTAGRVLVGTPYNIGANLRMSTANIQLDDGQGTIELVCETRDVFGERDAAQLCTSVSQLLRYPGDTILSDLVTTTVKTVEWGGKLQSAG